jgi:hypothetical protein
MEKDEFTRLQDRSLVELDELANRINRGEITIVEAEPEMASILQGMERATAAYTAAQAEAKRQAERSRRLYALLGLVAVFATVMVYWVAV